MLYKVEIRERPEVFDAVGEGIKKDIRDLGIETVQEARFVRIYLIEGQLLPADAERISRELLADRITQVYAVNKSKEPKKKNTFVVEIAHNPGVMDPVEASALKGIADLGIKGVESVRTAKKYIITGKLTPGQLNTISEKLLYNKLIQHIVKTRDARRATRDEKKVDYRFNLVEVNLLRVSDAKLKQISRNGQLFLSLPEMRRIKRYFKGLRRNPTDCELETIAQTWSEHCWHKTFKGRIEYTEQLLKRTTHDARRTTKHINNLLKSTIMKVTKDLNKPWCVSVFTDNSGVIRFDDKYNICFKVETHNHPSALEPFGGANTGIGGVIRDPLGTGLGAKPILNTDVFCFAPPDYPRSKLPAGALHPKRVMKGVVSGVRDYGNKMGIPTVNGAILFDSGFAGNPLVYCGTVGIMPKDKCFKHAKTGDKIVVVGGRTGRDGIHGATFSSGELTQDSETVSSGAVQIGDPIQEKKVLDTILQARGRNLYSAITDCGAGGLSSAVGEMGESLGARVRLEKAPLKYSGLSYTEIWISESQERMVLAVPPQKMSALMELFADENVEAAEIGEFTDTKRLQLYYKDNLVCDLEMEFLHKGLPQLTRKAVYMQPKHKERRFECPPELTKQLLSLLGDYDICSKEWVVRQYDHEVQGTSVLKPLAGINNDGPSDAAIARPLESSKGIILSNGINFRFGLIDPYWMAGSCIDEALRQIIAVGGSLKKAAILDNFCWGNPDKPDRLGSLVRASYGCYDIAKAFGVPFISGKDSLNNEYTAGGKSINIPGTLLISAIAVMDDPRKAISMYAKDSGDLVYIAGETYAELGASHYYKLLGIVGNSVPKVFPKKAKLVFGALSKASEAGLIKAMHDCSEGGIGVAAAEMSFSGGLGMELFLSEVPYKPAGIYEPRAASRGRRNDYILFSESNSRFIIEVSKNSRKRFEEVLRAYRVPFGLIGCVNSGKEFKVYGLDAEPCIAVNIEELKEAWQKPLRW